MILCVARGLAVFEVDARSRGFLEIAGRIIARVWPTYWLPCRSEAGRDSRFLCARNGFVCISLQNEELGKHIEGPGEPAKWRVTQWSLRKSAFDPEIPS